MAEVERRLAENEAAAANEIEIQLPASQRQPQQLPAANGVSTHDKKRGPRKKVNKQVMGQCEKCGYLSSQKICKACMLLDGLNKSRPQQTIEVGVEDEDSSTTLMRQVGALEISAG